MLMSALRVLINNLIKENFYEKKTINVLTSFFNVKTFQKCIVNQCPKSIH